MQQQSKGERYFKRGEALFKKGNFKPARRFFNLAASINYCNSACHLNLGMIDLFDLNLSEAFKNFQIVLTSSEPIGDVYYFMGLFFKAFDNTQESVSNFKKAILYSRQEHHRLLAFEELENQLSTQEYNELKKDAFNAYIIRTNIPKDNELMIKGIALRIRKEFDKAVKVFNEMIDLFPDSFLGYYELAKTYIKMKKHHMAYNILKKIKNLFHQDKMILKDLAKITFLLRKHKEAIFYIKQLIKLSPKNHKLYYNLGTTYALLNRDNEAVKYYKRSIKLNSNYFQVYYNLGVLYQKNGFLEEAQEYYLKAVAIQPENPELFFNLGLIYFEIEDYFQALYYFMKSYNLNNDMKEALNNFEVISNLKTIENRVVRPIELSLTSKVSLAFSIIILIVTFFYFIRWI